MASWLFQRLATAMFSAQFVIPMVMLRGWALRGCTRRQKTMIAEATPEIILPISSTLQWNYDVFSASAPVRNSPVDCSFQNFQSLYATRIGSFCAIKGL